MKEKQVRGFQPDATIKKIIQKDKVGQVGYLYRDGVVIVEKRTIKASKEVFEKEFVHIFPCELGIYANKSIYDSSSTFVGRLVVHDPSVLLDGVREASVYYENKSKAMEERGLSCDTVTIKTQMGMKIKDDIFPFLSSIFTIQNSHKMSIMNWDNYNHYLIWHGAIPKKEEIEQNGQEKTE